MINNDKIICSETGKKISGFDGEVTIKVEFSEECRYYIFNNIVLHIINGEIDINNSFPDIFQPFL